MAKRRVRDLIKVLLYDLAMGIIGSCLAGALCFYLLRSHLDSTIDKALEALKIKEVVGLDSQPGPDQWRVLAETVRREGEQDTAASGAEASLGIAISGSSKAESELHSLLSSLDDLPIPSSPGSFEGRLVPSVKDAFKTKMLQTEVAISQAGSDAKRAQQAVADLRQRVAHLPDAYGKLVQSEIMAIQKHYADLYKGILERKEALLKGIRMRG